MRQDSYYENETKMTMIDWWCWWFAVEHLMLFVGRESLVRCVCIVEVSLEGVCKKVSKRVRRCLQKDVEKCARRCTTGGV